jgi:cell division protein FtsX
MKNQLLTIVAIFLLAVFAIMLTACDLFPVATPDSIFDSVVRIHIRANSNSDIDQEIKLKVRDQITAYLGDILMECEDKKQALEKMQTSDNFMPNLSIKEKIFKKFKNFFD